MSHTPPDSELGEVSAGLVVERELPPLGPWRRWIVVDRHRWGRRLLLSMVQQRGDAAVDLDEVQRRAQRVRGLVHPALTRVTDSGRIPDGIWVVEEVGALQPLCDAGSHGAGLAGLLHLVEALAHVHQQGLVHGKVGPETILAGRGRLLLSALALGGLWGVAEGPEDDVRAWAGLALAVLGQGPEEPAPDAVLELLRRVSAGVGWVPGDGRRMAEQMHGALGAVAPVRPVARPPDVETGAGDVKRPSMSRRILTGVGAAIQGALTTVLTVALLVGIGAAGLMYALEGGPRETVVPNLLGMSYEDAAAGLVEEGLVVGALRRAYRDDVGPNQVAAMNPPPGMKVREGREVSLVVSRGSAEVRVPLLVGLQVGEAEKLLEKAGLTLKRQGERRSDAPSGEVVSQDPAAESMTGRGAEVSVMLSGGEDYGLVRVKDSEGEVQTILFREVEIIVGEGERIQRVTVLKGGEGAMEAIYDRPHRPGDRVKVEVEGRPGTRIEVEIEGKSVYKTQL